MATRFQLQHFITPNEYYRMYDTNFESPEPGEHARYEINIDEANRIKNNEPFYIYRGEIIFELISEVVVEDGE